VKTAVALGALLVVGVIAFALFNKYSAQLVAASNPQGIVNLNRGNADTSLMYQAGLDALNYANSWAPQPPYGGA
jgi:hypothetical protein